MKAPRFDLILITEPALEDPVRFVKRALVDVEPQRVAVQLRAKSWSSTQRLDAALAIAEITRATHSTLLINGDLDTCIAADVDGIQLPHIGPSLNEARAMLGADRWIGVSCHSANDVLSAERDGADFMLLSPWGDVPGKGAALGALQFSSIATLTWRPVYALGGIDHAALPEVLSAGARGLAVIRAAHVAADPSAWIRDALATIQRHRAPQDPRID